MRLRRLNILLLLVLLVCLCVSWTARRDFRRPNTEFLPDMAHSPAYAAQGVNPNFKDGKTLQSPALGTIARGYAPLHYEPTPADALRAGQELQNPINHNDLVAVQRGAVVFASICQHCHGAGGLGDGPVAKRGFPPPPSLLAEHSVQMKDGQMFHVMTYGQGNMPAHAAHVEREDRWKVICHIRSLQNQSRQSQTAPATQLASGHPASRGDSQ